MCVGSYCALYVILLVLAGIEKILNTRKLKVAKLRVFIVFECVLPGWPGKKAVHA